MIWLRRIKLHHKLGQWCCAGIPSECPDLTMNNLLLYLRMKVRRKSQLETSEAFHFWFFRIGRFNLKRQKTYNFVKQYRYLCTYICNWLCQISKTTYISQTSSTFGDLVSISTPNQSLVTIPHGVKLRILNQK
jgi:hypothetical protein